MRTLFFLSLFCITICIVPAFSQCLDDQKSLLLGLRNSLIFDHSESKKLVRWNQTKDCCTWDGVECDVFGHVISLQLDEEAISDGIENSDYLFNLSYLEKLNLADNNFFDLQIPKGLSNLANLTHLNLSGAGFAGQVPREVLRLKKLVSLDLSGIFNELKLENPNLKMLVQNLKGLEELYLDSVNISSWGNDWCQVLSSSLPNLRILSLRYCDLSGPIDSSLLELRSLSVLHLDGNNLASRLPDFFADSRLSVLELRDCRFFGPIPLTIGNLTELTFLDISWNNFTGSIPLFGLSKNLTYIDASNNSLMGSLSSMHFEGLSHLAYINLAHNLLSGNIPSSLFALPSLQKLKLSNNEFQGQVQELSNMSSSPLQELDLSSNHLEGPIPKFFFELEHLKELSLSSNNFNGTVQLEMFKNPNLSRLELSHNDLFVQSPDIESSLPLLPNMMRVLKLASCKLQRFPYLARQSSLYELDLSSNQLKGEIPNWIWEIGNGSLRQLNLSYNLLHGFQKPYNLPGLIFLDLHSNQFQGELPIPPLSSVYVDYSHNYFTNSIPDDIGTFLPEALFFSVANNSLTGEIPPSICNATSLNVLDLSANALSGSIPPCLPKRAWYLGVLSLGGNNLSGNIPDTFSVYCSLKTLDLNKNILGGKIPRSLVHCPFLEVLNIGNNRLEDTFPCMLMNTSLRVLILRSNKFYGDLQCPKATHERSNLQIIDISTNNFSGDISLLSFSKWRGMINANDNKQPWHNHLRYDFSAFLDGYYYQDAVTLSMKGLEMELTKILIIFTSINLSNNKFHGEIPYSIGDLKSLYGLNLSHNELIGSIPASIGNLTQLGSLDLSVNKLTGMIPAELASLTFISFLNLSYNRLFGKIPEGSQFETFSATSYEGNVGLCGFPVNISCNKEESDVSTPRFQNGEVNSKKEIEWNYVSAALGFAVGFGSTVWLLLHWKRLREMYFGKVDQMLLKLFSKW